jgi:aldose 1-epimerase
MAGYPFSFLLKMRYTLSPKGFACRTGIKNRGNGRMLLGDGWHPYFTLHRKIDTLHLRLPSTKAVHVNGLGIPSGNKFVLDRFAERAVIGNRFLDTGFVLSGKKGIAETELYDSRSNVSIVAWQETGRIKYNYLQVFTPPHRRSIAVEPMTCNADAFNNKEGLIVLKPGHRFCGSYGVYLA